MTQETTNYDEIKKEKHDDYDYESNSDSYSDFHFHPDFDSHSESDSHSDFDSDSEDEIKNSNEYEISDDINENDFENHKYDNNDDSPKASCSQDNNTWNTNNEMPNIESFIGQSGIKVHTPETPLKFLQLFITRELLEHFTKQTNRYADKCKSDKKHHYKNWYKASVVDIAKFLGLTILLGVYKLPRLSMYWARNATHFAPGIADCLSYKRYMSLNGFFHSNASDSETDSQDRLSKLSPIIDYFLHLFKMTYTPTQNLSIDEGMLAFKGKLNFESSSPIKESKQGIKLYILAESETGFVSNFMIYSGARSSTSEIVSDLLKDFKNKNYHVYMNEFYNSVKLSEKLLQEKIYTCGTSHLHHTRGAPNFFKKSLNDLKKGDVTFCRKGDVFVIAWKNRKLVNMVSTNNNASTQTMTKNTKSLKNGKKIYRQETVKTPIAFIDYNKNMNGVKYFDQMMKKFSFARRSHRWSKKITFYLLHMAMYNAYALYKQYTTDKKAMDLIHFHIMASTALMKFKHEEWPLSGHDIDPNDPYCERDVKPQEIVPTDNSNAVESDFLPDRDIFINKSKIIFGDPIIRLDKTRPHIIELLPGKKRLSCRVCHKVKNWYNSSIDKKRNIKTTRYKCATCDIPLCIGVCHSFYHTYKDYVEKVKTYQMTK